MRDVRMHGFRERTSVSAALAMLERRTSSLGVERVGVTSAHGRVVAEAVVAGIDVPAFARSAMDGFAVVGESTFGASAQAPIELAVIGETKAGRSFAGTVRYGQAVRITTGAPIPLGADAIVMAEVTERAGDTVRVREPVAPGKHVGAVGEDIRRGDLVVERGRRLRPQDLGVLASLGIADILVVRRPRVSIAITGDEVLPAGDAPRDALIADANGPMLRALAERDGAAALELRYLPDDRDALRAVFAAHAGDVLLISGGSSVGPEDHAPIVLAELGELAVHGVALRPASPAGFGFLPTGCPVFLLPGNPVSCLCAYEFFAGPTIRALGGRSRAWPHRRARLPLAAKIVSELGRTDYMRVAIVGGRVAPIMTSGASILSSTTRADGVVIVAAHHEGHGEGEEVEVQLYDNEDPG
ncbi:MAG TPA: gephyrin-like molybdotransferase Glp [Kofleriaceae bacterium]|jgi:molybdopterin molybdotransferase|nr:gephyrin-like molybdotransferase Glp [Kofleriaceae bacterium]